MIEQVAGHGVAAVSAGEVYGIGSAQCVGTGELAGVALDRLSQLDRACRRPVAVPVPLGRIQFGLSDVVVAGGSSEGGADLWVGEPAGHGGVAPIPELGGQVGSFLLSQQLHERAGRRDLVRIVVPGSAWRAAIWMSRRVDFGVEHDSPGAAVADVDRRVWEGPFEQLGAD